MVYEDLLCMGLSCRSIEKVIETVLDKLADTEVERLPKPTFAKYMLLEARGLAQIHVASELIAGKPCKNSTFHKEKFEVEVPRSLNDIFPSSTSSNNNTVHSDGTSKKGRSYTIYDITQ